MSEPGERPAAARRRLRGFQIHLLVFILASVGLVGAALLLDHGRPWYVLLMVAWGAPLAIHCAYAMGLFGPRRL